ncbi:hypothetical protein [Actinomadura sp. SCN-SB]|uniref:hypothetical protein n=1 Tax=Actinomadura sp. SCN-SB TaxID=3373092 RepID=UPI003752226E
MTHHIDLTAITLTKGAHHRREDGTCLLDTARVYLAVDWLVRVYAPACLRLVPALAGDADVLSGLGPVRSPGDAVAAGELARGAASRAAAAMDAAMAARAAARAAWDAMAAAMDAALAARDAARAAGAAARAAWDARAAWYAAMAARAAAWDAARGELAPTVTHLQDSAISLYHAMIQPPVDAPPEPEPAPTDTETAP